MCIRHTATLACATVWAMAGSAVPAVTSFTMHPPHAIALRAVEDRRVSIEKGMDRRPSSSQTGTIRRCSSSSPTDSEPGRVLSPPTSIRSAPSAIISTAWATAASGSSHLPPSENESGVTFKIPMTAGRPSGRLNITQVREGRIDRGGAKPLASCPIQE